MRRKEKNMEDDVLDIKDVFISIYYINLEKIYTF
jgi:hypothetical protein